MKFARDGLGLFCKTIFHEKSQKREKGINGWIHPDIVGVKFSIQDFKEYRYVYTGDSDAWQSIYLQIGEQVVINVPAYDSDTKDEYSLDGTIQCTAGKQVTASMLSYCGRGALVLYKVG